MRELTMNEILAIGGGIMNFEEFSKSSQSIPAEFMKAAYSSYLSAQPNQKELAASGVASANYDWGGGGGAWAVTFRPGYWCGF
ncbi:MAG: hypothetical protein V4805_18325 [Pseudomonadota bacterium]